MSDSTLPVSTLPPGLDSIPMISPRARIQTDKVTGKPVLVSQETVVKLNATAADILALCDGHRTVGQIAAELAANYNAPLETISSNTSAYLAKLAQLNLVNWRE